MLFQVWGPPSPVLFPWQRPFGRQRSHHAALCRRSPWFNGWGFNLPRGQSLLDKWNLIPEGIDILMTHGPPLGESATPSGRRFCWVWGGRGIRWLRTQVDICLRPCRVQGLGPQGAAAGRLRGAAQHGPEEGAAQTSRLRTHTRRYPPPL